MADTEQHPEGEGEAVAITRYPNRRLYDRSQGRYVTLPEIAELVRQGKTVVVRDSKTGDDLTRSILMQIILEHHPERMTLFPVAVLNSIIGANESALGILRDYFRQSRAYLELLQRSAAVNPLVLMTDWMRAFLPNLSPPSHPAGPAPTGVEDAAVLARRVAELERRLAEMQASLGKARPPAASPADPPAGLGREQPGASPDSA